MIKKTKFQEWSTNFWLSNWKTCFFKKADGDGKNTGIWTFYAHGLWSHRTYIWIGRKTENNWIKKINNKKISVNEIKKIWTRVVGEGPEGLTCVVRKGFTNGMTSELRNECLRELQFQLLEYFIILWANLHSLLHSWIKTFDISTERDINKSE